MRLARIGPPISPRLLRSREPRVHVYTSAPGALNPGQTGQPNSRPSSRDRGIRAPKRMPRLPPRDLSARGKKTFAADSPGGSAGASLGEPSERPAHAHAGAVALQQSLLRILPRRHGGTEKNKRRSLLRLFGYEGQASVEGGAIVPARCWDRQTATSTGHSFSCLMLVC